MNTTADGSEPEAAIPMILALEDAMWPRDRTAMRTLLRQSLPRYRNHPALLTRRMVRSRMVADWREEGDGIATLALSGRQGLRPMDMLYLCDDPVLQKAFARRHGDDVDADTQASGAVAHRHGSGRAKPVLRIGYLASQFREHAGGRLLAEVFERHDRRRVEIMGYSTGTDDGSALRRRIVEAFDAFADLSGCSDDDAAGRIRADGIDILVDCDGFALESRTGIVWRRPAPVQVSYLGFPGTMAMSALDYVIADPVVMPPAVAAHFTEQAALLPESYQANDSKRAIAERSSRRAAGLPSSAFVFCCFNYAHKITPEVFDRWMALLRHLDDAVLWLLESNELVAANLQQEAAARGVDPGRLVFAPLLPPEEHLARLGLADLALDTLPYGGHTTTSDALWAGVPVVTCLGRTFAGRVAASLLTAIGLPELVVSDLDAYEALAFRLASRRRDLAAIRRRLALNRRTDPLFDCSRFTAHLETAFELMWTIHCDGGTPRPFGVVPVRRGAITDRAAG